MSGRGRGRRKNPEMAEKEPVEEPEGEPVLELGGAMASVPSAEAPAMAGPQFNAEPENPVVCRKNPWHT